MKKILSILLLINLQVFAMDRASFGLNINTDDLEVEGRTSLSFTTNDPTYRNFFVDANLINSDETLFGFGVFVENSPINYQNIAFSIGLRTIFSKDDGDSFTAIPIIVGAKARMYLGNLPKSNLGLKFAYAPSPLSFQDADSYFEYRIEVDMSIIENINVYLGYRSIDTNYEKKDLSYNSSLYVGFKFVLE
jgi:hypothetical protein